MNLIRKEIRNYLKVNRLTQKDLSNEIAGYDQFIKHTLNSPYVLREETVALLDEHLFFSDEALDEMADLWSDLDRKPWTVTRDELKANPPVYAREWAA